MTPPQKDDVACFITAQNSYACPEVSGHQQALAFALHSGIPPVNAGADTRNACCFSFPGYLNNRRFVMDKRNGQYLMAHE
jgi:hypothetical protein